MKFIRLFIFAALACLSTMGWGQVVDLTFVNTNVVGTPPNARLEFEIHMRASIPGTYHIGGNIYLKYNAGSFNSNIVSNGGITVTNLTLMDNPAYIMNPQQDFQANTVSINWINFQSFVYNPPSAFHIEIPDTGFTPFCKVSMAYVNTGVPPVITMENFTSVSYETSMGVPSSYTVNLINASLPVEWISFTADRLDNRNIQLRWETAKEINNDYFLVQRSVDGQLFEEIGKVQGAGTTDAPTTYKFLDNTYQANINYYRLKQVDYNGAFEYSNIVEVRFNGSGDEVAFHVFPSPAREFVNVEVLGPIGTSSFEVKIFDQLGRIVHQGRLDKDHLRKRVEVSNLPEGIYNYEIIGNLQILKTGRFLKL